MSIIPKETYQPYITDECDFVFGSSPYGNIFNIMHHLKYSFPVLEFQLLLSSVTSIMAWVLLKPLGIPTTVAQIAAGIALGPSILGRILGTLRKLFPIPSLYVTDIFAYYALIFQIFLVGLKVDPMMIRRTGIKGIIICILVIVVSTALSTSCAIILYNCMHVDDKLYRYLLVVGVVESIPTFPSVACFLAELNIFNTEFSDLALSSSLISSIIHLSVLACLTAFQREGSYVNGTLYGCLCLAIVVMVIMFILRPAVNWMIKRIPEGKTIKEGYLCILCTAVLMLAFLCRKLDVDIVFGPLIFGLIIPPGPPLGSALVERIEFFIKWMIIPLFYTEIGLWVNVFRFKLRTTLLVALVVLVCCTGKFLGAFVPALYYKLSYRDATLLGLTMNAQGFMELSFYLMLWDRAELFNIEIFRILVLSALVITGASAPLVRYLSKLSMKYKLHSRRTIRHFDPDAELRVLACIHDEQNVLSTVHLMKATNPTKISPINLSIIHFEEIVGHETPQLVSHKSHRRSSSATTVSQRIINVFKSYEENNEGRVSVHPYTVVTAYTSMHTDACRLVIDNMVSIIIVPFHKQLDTGFVNNGIRTVNKNLLEHAPCSVGILIDRGLLGGINNFLENQSFFDVAVVFLGGPDDREALVYAERMSEHPNIKVTVIRFLKRSKLWNKTYESSLDEDTLSYFKLRGTYNNRLTYIHEDVNNGLDVISVIGAMGDKYQMIILGRRHDENSALILELTDWDKCSELGTIGDIFETSNYGGKATILLMQQHPTQTASSD
ncbi:hypothetical protein IFM89_012242 [Coptis chinensis]|uniref:Cation/H+ exchanger domain-containing protein n=1 Tax=Coptis chinensis TaxID=261450 RepID=A0A835HC09_9MAGN|nr:hypothetical protein IFM89_012242 [Coptis chinensis]